MNNFISKSEGLLVLPLRIQNANAISSPLTHGFPSITAFTGVMWALERKLAEQGVELEFNGVGVVAHDYDEQTHDGYVKTFRLTRNPVDKTGSTAAIVEEGRIHLDITLILAASGNPERNVIMQSEAECQQVAWKVADILSSMRVAGGSVLPSQRRPGRRTRPQLIRLSDNAESRLEQFRVLRRQWLPGFALVSRDELLQQRLTQLQTDNAAATSLDAWLDLSRFNWRPTPVNEGQEPVADGKVEWQHDRPAGTGWIVPIPVGYGALSELYEAGSVKNARDQSTPFRFVESLYSIGEWISPHRLQDITDLLWYADSQPENGLYRCRNDFVKPLEIA